MVVCIMVICHLKNKLETKNTATRPLSRARLAETNLSCEDFINYWLCKALEFRGFPGVSRKALQSANFLAEEVDLAYHRPERKVAMAFPTAGTKEPRNERPPAHQMNFKV